MLCRWMKSSTLAGKILMCEPTLKPDSSPSLNKS